MAYALGSTGTTSLKLRVFQTDYVAVGPLIGGKVCQLISVEV